MTQQIIKVIGTSGASSRRVVDTLTPINGAGAPSVNAEFLGQIYIDTAAPAMYISVVVDSATPADDWKLVTFTS